MSITELWTYLIGGCDMLKSVSYRLDAMYMTLTPTKNTRSFMDSFNRESRDKNKPYRLREPKNRQEIRVQKGYDPERTLMMDLDIGNEIIHTVNVFVKLERKDYESYETGFIMFAGRQLDYVPYEDIMKTFESWVKVTRSDVAADLTYSNSEKMHREHMKLCRYAGFNPKAKISEVYKQSKKNALTGGGRNKRSPIRKAELHTSNGLTLYIGAKKGRFRVRVYDKSAEALKKTGVEMEPTLRLELEVGDELATAVSKELLKVNKETTKRGYGHHLAPWLWHTLADGHISFTPQVNTRTLGEVMGMDNVSHIQLDYSKIEGKKLEYYEWWRKQVAPSFNKLHDHMSDLEQIKVFWELTKGEPLDIKKLAREIAEDIEKQ